MLRIVALAFLAVCYPSQAQDDGIPFGPVSDGDVDRLGEFAKKFGFDLKPEME